MRVWFSIAANYLWRCFVAWVLGTICGGPALAVVSIPIAIWALQGASSRCMGGFAILGAPFYGAIVGALGGGVIYAIGALCFKPRSGVADVLDFYERSWRYFVAGTVAAAISVSALGMKVYPKVPLENGLTVFNLVLFLSLLGGAGGLLWFALNRRQEKFTVQITH